MHISEEQSQKEINKIATFRDKNERLAWKRKKEKLENLVKELEPIDDKILKIILEEKYPIQDKIAELRAELVQDCVHPKDHLVHYGNHVVCKFCEAKIAVVRNESK